MVNWKLSLQEYKKWGIFNNYSSSPNGLWVNSPWGRHLHQRISEHRYSAIGKHLETQHGNNRTKTDHLFKVLRKCNSKFDCLVYEMLYIKDIKPSLNTQADSIRAKLFTWHFRTFFFSYCVSYLGNYTQIFYVLFQILYIRLTPYTFSLFNLIMA